MYDLREAASEMTVSDQQLDQMITNHTVIAGSRAPEKVRSTSEEYLAALRQLRKLRQATIFG